MQAIVASISWEMLTKQSENMTSDEYDTLLGASKPALGMKLPSDVGKRQNLKKWWVWIYATAFSTVSHQLFLKVQNW